jgi:uncharacterized protein DUF4166
MQFFGADECHQVRLDGAMHRVWHRHTWLGPFFRLLARVDILFPESGRDVPASMTIARVDQGTAWRRTFSFAKIRRFNATMTYQPQCGVVERIGPGGAIEVPWRVRSLGRDTIEITTGRLRVRAGPLRLPIPGVLQVAVRAVERAVANAIHVDLVVSHPVLGAFFGYDGTFAVRRQALDVPKPEPSVGISLDGYRPWFYAAAAYNLAWGLVVIVWPLAFFRLIRMPAPTDIAIWQALGMMVLVYAPAYWWVARDPIAHRHLVVIALLGKILGPFGFLWALNAHTLPLIFGLTIVTNDCLWWPAFTAFLIKATRFSGGWRGLLQGR